MKDTDCSHYEEADGDCLTNACSGCCLKYRAELESLRLATAEEQAEADVIKGLIGIAMSLMLDGTPVGDHNYERLPVKWAERLRAIEARVAAARTCDSVHHGHSCFDEDSARKRAERERDEEERWKRKYLLCADVAKRDLRETNAKLAVTEAERDEAREERAASVAAHLAIAAEVLSLGLLPRADISTPDAVRMVCDAYRLAIIERDEALLASAPTADAATEATGYPPTLADARMHIERLTRSLSQPHSADERFFAINEARTWLAKTAAAKADAATEGVEIVNGVLVREQRTKDAIQRARDKGSLVPCPKCGHEKWHDNLCFGCEVKADPEVSTPAPAPSADRCAAGHDWIRRGEGSCGDRYVCLRCGERKP